MSVKLDHMRHWLPNMFWGSSFSLTACRASSPTSPTVVRIHCLRTLPTEKKKTKYGMIKVKYLNNQLVPISDNPLHPWQVIRGSNPHPTSWFVSFLPTTPPPMPKHITLSDLPSIISDRVLRTRKQSGVRRILKVCNEYAGVSAMNKRLQNSVRHNSTNFLYFVWKFV